MKPVEHVAPREAYDRWASVYDTDGNPLVALDDEVVPARSGTSAGRCSSRSARAGRSADVAVSWR